MTEEKKTHKYHVWITALLSAYEKGIVHGLVNKGYNVSAADGKGALSLTFKGAACSVIAIRVEKDTIVASELMDDVKAVLATINAKYNSVVISEYTLNCTWHGTNIVLNDNSISETKPVDKKAN